MQSRIGLVFAGGGGKGAYQIGVWKALEELGIAQRVEAVAGTSVGALNAALFAQGDYSLAENVWRGISSVDVLHLPKEKLIDLVGKITIYLTTHQHGKILSYFIESGLFSRMGLMRVINETLCNRRLRTRNMRFYANCSRLCLRLFRAEYFSLHGCDLAHVRRVLLASSAIPGVFAQESINGATYCDGYFTDNTPVKSVYKDGCNLIIVVFLSRDDWINPADYPGAIFIPIMPRDDPGGLFTGVMRFDRIQEKIDCGYQDARHILEPLRLRTMTQSRWLEVLAHFQMQQQEFQQNIARSVQLRQETDDLRQELANELAKW